MIDGSIWSSNVGNFHPRKFDYLCSLSDPKLAALLHDRIEEIQPDLCLIQEIWFFMQDVLGDKYEMIGIHDTIAVKKTFGHIVPGSFKSHTFRFKKSATTPIYPDLKDSKAVDAHRHQLETQPYYGELNSSYGSPADFDIVTATIETVNGCRFKVANVHVTSASWRDKIRARELKQWILDEFIPQAQQETAGKMIIAGDFNQDELRQKGESSDRIKQIIQISGMHDASYKNREHTSNLPKIFPRLRLDHILGTAEFSDYQVMQALSTEGLNELKKHHPFLWWMHLDHKSLFAKFRFEK